MKGCTWVFVATLLCQQFCLFRVTAAKRERKMKKEPNQYTEPFNATLSNSEELHGHPKILESPDPRITDPRRTWISFVHRPDDGNTSKRRCKGKDKKLRGLVGPPGPPGPQGPPGAPGAEVTREVLLQEFKEILKEAIERRASLAISAHPSQLPPLLLSLEEVSHHRRVEEAFHCKLKGQVIVDKKTLVELQNFQSVRRDYRLNLCNSTTAIPLAKGAFLRGTGLNLATGRFTAPVSGIYQFSANVHIDHSELKSKVQLRARDNVRVLICIESLCHRYTSLEVIAGLESNSKIFTIYVHGLLQLQAGQYTSIFVDNSAGAPITIQNGSDFMGMLMGT
nr:PREDICTED: adipolin isoform X1 [Haliaeetus albicilla]XP_009921167.1 PREDICTED: adipolin isoform X1 [Haliaeetus albicilla]XP_009921168.1 PREDICTED: adipolin isoform X1 [Haliaeetus albicilla]